MLRTNYYEGKCRVCHATIPVGAGYLFKRGPTNRVYCAGHRDNGIAWQADLPTAPDAPLPDKAPTLPADKLDGAVDTVVELMARKMAELVPELVKDNLVLLSRVAEIKIGKMPAVKVDVAHNMLETVLTAVMAGASPMLVGPAGSGKTTLAEQVATTLGRKFYMEARVTSEFKLIGFIDAHGKVVHTQFREAYEKGGVFLFDEVDASDADAMTAFNAALANGLCAFPDKLVKRHKDFVAIAAGNTFGRGADRQYVGRNQLDAATLDRFAVFEVDYDEQLELAIAGDADWVRRVQAVRSAVLAEQVRHIVSPRASITGARMLAAGMERAKVEEALIWKGLDKSNRSRVEARLGGRS